MTLFAATTDCIFIGQPAVHTVGLFEIDAFQGFLGQGRPCSPGARNPFVYIYVAHGTTVWMGRDNGIA